MKIQTLILMMSAGAVFAQQITDTRTPTRRSEGGDGKCTIEVEVDDTAEVEIYGNRAQIRTLSGSPATFRRFECNQDIPTSPNDFRFKGIDGRGRQELVRSPGGRNPAAIRIEDSKGGREGYTFDIFWRGGTGINSNNTGSVFGGNNDGFGNNRGGFGNNNRGRGSANRGGFGNNNANSNWNRELNFRGRGDGNFRDDRGNNTRLQNCRVTIDRRGNVEVSFQTDSAMAVMMTGRVQRMDNDRIYADMNGNNVGGVMEIDTDGQNRVQSVNMRSTGGRNNRFELTWHD
jgi:hypothetical protein